ncbi:hypothetical protein KP509_07G092300 [Ceratopteris richardii]|uniref:AIR9-like A9 domain-containing protein n=1 Tax=Ceratopteris richardii TaxID=49495 RepID=A0A8T2UD80_CERRI|nr:hypothetical protein KP509_07G092300 [Ceratopteris richardii]
MAHIAPSEYAFHGREAHLYDGAPDYYADYLPPHIHDEQMGFHRRTERQISEDASALGDALAGIELAHGTRGRPGHPHNNELVVHAIEAAASVLRDQASALREQITENERLRRALRVRDWELQKYHRIDQGQAPSHPENQSREEFQQVISNIQPLPSRELWGRNVFAGYPQNSLIIHPNAQKVVENHHRLSSRGVQSQPYGSNIGINDAARKRVVSDGAFPPTSSPMSPTRHGIEGENGTRFEPAGTSGNVPSQQEIVQSATRPQDEINHLKKLLSDCGVKEMQLVHENHMLENRIAELRLTIDKYQQELINSNLKEENARLIAEMRAIKEDITVYEKSLLSLLEEFNLPSVTTDPHSIVSGIKALVQHLREQARKDPLSSKPAWQNPPMYQQNEHAIPSSPSHPRLWAPYSPEPHGLEIVPRPLSPTSPISHNVNDWEYIPHRNFGNDNLVNESSRRPPYPAQVAEPRQLSPRGYNAPPLGQASDFYNDTDEEKIVTTPGSVQPYQDRNIEIRSPRLPPVTEEQNSSFSEEEDPLPDIEGLSITGEAVLGNKIQACGVSINGTTLCHFQWVRHHQADSYFHIPGAAQPQYTITADDVDTILSLECTPMDDRNRKGEMIQVYVNDKNRITLEPDMREQITEYLENAQASFDVKLVGETPETSEPATLTLKRSMYELKKLNGRRIIGNEKYVTESATMEIKVGKDAQCAILNHSGAMHLLDCSDNRTRDLLVLTMREFIKAALDRKRVGKKRLWIK